MKTSTALALVFALGTSSVAFGQATSAEDEAMPPADATDDAAPNADEIALPEEGNVEETECDPSAGGAVDDRSETEDEREADLGDCAPNVESSTDVEAGGEAPASD